MLKFGRKINGVQAHYLTFISTYSSSPSSKISTSSRKAKLLADFLVKSLGFSKQQSLTTSTRFFNLFPKAKKKVINFTFAENATSVINFFKQNGFEDTHIRKVVTLEPRVLTAKIDYTLKPKIKLLKDLGISESDLVRVVSSNPTIVRVNLDDSIKALRVVLGSDENVISFLKKSTLFAVHHAAKHLILNVKLLENVYGMSADKIRGYILQNSRPFLQKSVSFKNTVRRVEYDLGIPRDSGMFFYGIYILVCLSQKTIQSKCGVLKSFGWSEIDVAAIIRRNPCCLMTSELRIKKALEFYMNELGYESAFLASRPTLLMFSLEERVIPRYRVYVVLKEKGFLSEKHSFYTILYLSKSKFFQKFVQPFVDVLPDLSQEHLNNSGTQGLDQQIADSPEIETNLRSSG